MTAEDTADALTARIIADAAPNLSAGRLLDQLFTVRRQLQRSYDHVDLLVRTANQIADDLVPALFEAEGLDPRDATTFLYWLVPEVNVGPIAAEIGVNKAKVYQLAQPAPITGECEDCGTTIRPTSRTSSSRFHHGVVDHRTRVARPQDPQVPTKCEECQQRDEQLRDQQREEARQAERRRWQALAAMDHEAYRSTLEWRDRVAVLLQWQPTTPEGNKIACSLCPATSKLGVYMRVGEPPVRADAVIVCHSCGQLLEQRGHHRDMTPHDCDLLASLTPRTLNRPGFSAALMWVAALG
jgi:hypothetical protein